MRSSARLVGVSVEDLDRVWPLVLPWVEDAARSTNGRMGAEDFYRFVRDRDMQLWVVADEGEIKCCVLTEIVVYPKNKFLRISAAVGQGRDDWQHLIADLKAYAKTHGCRGVESLARPGWERVLDGTKTHVFLEWVDG